jgi:nitroreductase
VNGLVFKILEPLNPVILESLNPIYLLRRIIMLKDLVLKNRSRRRFYEEAALDMNTLKELVDLARCSASGANRQPLKYMLSCDAEKNDKIFPNLFWAAALKDWPGPGQGERPSAYIIVLGDKEISSSFGVDHGIAAQSILLGAVEKGLGGCMMGAINIEGLRQALQIPDRYVILLVIALGKPKEEVILETVGSDGKTNYWRDERDVHHVPKRSLDEIIIES